MRVERGKRFIQKQNFRLRHKGTRKGHTLALTTRQLGDIAFSKLPDAQPF